MKKIEISFLFITVSALLVAGCGSKAVSPASSDQLVTKDPVTITIGMNKSMLSDDEIKQYVSDPVSKRFPNITVQRIDTSQKGSTLPDLEPNFAVFTLMQ